MRTALLLTFVAAADVRFLEVAEYTDHGQSQRRVSGLVLHRVLAVKSVEARSDAGEPWVLVQRTPAGRERSGQFEVDVPIPRPGATVRFSPDKSMVRPTNAH